VVTAAGAVELCFSDLEASTGGVVAVAPTDIIELAVTRMALLPVLPGPRSLKGVVKWKSLGEARLRRVPNEVRECMIPADVVRLVGC
jgi:hypothetical protein